MVETGAAVIVSTPSGNLRGSYQQSSEGVDYYAFKGIPYALPPVGQRRFRDPEPIQPWTDIRDAVEFGPICPQMDQETKSVVGSEDCLYLNVYTRSIDSNARAPVMFWIHGGIFFYGSGNDDMFGPDYLLRENVVLVTINYRLGVFGFLNLEDESIPGNMGFKDQVMALRWVNKSIAHFGGDPENVTVFGGSAGSGSVHYLTMSTMAKGLLHKAICQSGCALNPWGLVREPFKSCAELLKILGWDKDARHPNQDKNEMADFLVKADYRELIKAQQTLVTSMCFLKIAFPFGPTVDDKSHDPFMPVNINEVASEGVQVPLMIGYNSLECNMGYKWLQEIPIEKYDRHFEKFIPQTTLDMLKSYNLTPQDLRKLYFNSEPITEQHFKKFFEFHSDLSFIEGTHRLVKIQYHNSAAPTYLYKFSYTKNITLAKKFINSPVEGAYHGDELTYLFKAKRFDDINLKQLQEGTGAERVMKQMITLWTNFARTGRPTPATSELIPYYWQPIASDVVLRYMNIDEELRMGKMLNIEQRYSFKKKVRHVY